LSRPAWDERAAVGVGQVVQREAVGPEPRFAFAVTSMYSDGRSPAWLLCVVAPGLLPARRRDGGVQMRSSA
jgi:hypothetical protein